MSALTSLLARDQVVPVRKIEEALQKQVVSGGEMSSVLLELDALPENTLAAYCAALYGLLPATRDEVMRVGRDSIRLVPREIAERHRLVPLAVDGRTLLVAMAHPLNHEVEEQLGFLLGFTLMTRVVCDVRIAAGLVHHYSVEPTPRHVRLIDKLRQRDAGAVPYVAPPQDAKADRNSLSLLPQKRTSTADWLDDDDDDQGRPSAKIAIAAVPPIPSVPTPTLSPATSSAPDKVAPQISKAPAPLARPSDASSETAKALRKLRGPLTAAAAAKLLEGAQQRDEILEVFFAFARQFFDYAALFMVHDEVADGRDAWGPGASIDAVRRIAVPLDVPGAFGDVRRNLAPRLGPMDSSELDAIVLRDLQRSPSMFSLVLPIAMRGRAVLLFYADRNGDPFEITDLPDLIGFVPHVLDAFEKLIMRRKRSGAGFTRAPDDAKEDRERLKAAAKQVAQATPSTRPPRPSSLPSAKESAGQAEASSGTESPPEDEPPAPAPENPGRPARPRRQSASAMEVAEMTKAGAENKQSIRNMLGIPRDAPPPPALEKQATLPPISDRPPARQTSPAPATELGDDEPELTLDAADPSEFDESEDDELEHEPIPLSNAMVRSESSPRGGYRLRDAPTDVVAASRPSEPPAMTAPPRRSGRPDPRSEEIDVSIIEDVVRVPDIDARKSAPPTGRRTTRSAPPPPPSDDMPSVIVDMGDHVNQLVLDLTQCGPEDDRTAIDALLRVGESALPTLAQAFPGPPWFDRRRPFRKLPKGRDVSAIARALVGFRERAVPYVASLLDAAHTDRRFFAVLVAGDIVHPGLISALSERLFDDDEGIRAAVLEIFPRFKGSTPEWNEVMTQIRRAAKIRGRDPLRRQKAARALGAIRDGSAIRMLIELLDDEDTALREVVHRALVDITCEDMGTAARRWRNWLQKNEARHRVEWLIDALSHSDESIRSAASEELKQLTQQYYGYHPSSPRKEREVVQQKYRKWWDQEGHRLFTNASA